MKNTALWALAFALAVGCGSESKTGDTVPTGGVPGPEGSDGFYTVSDLAAQEGALLQDIAVSEDTIYGCTGGHGLMVAKRVGWTGLELVGYVTFTDGKGCRAVTVAPDGALFATGQADAGGSFVASLEPGTGNVQSSVVLPGLTIESMVASETHVFTALGEGGITILGRSGGGLAEVSTLANGFEQALGIALWDNKRIVVANGRYFADRMLIAPQAKLDDGLLDMLVIGDINKLEFLRLWPELYKGSHIVHPMVMMEKVTTVTVESAEGILVEADGELLGEGPVSFRVLPSTLTVVA